MSNVGKELKPSKFSIESIEPKQDPKPNQFGQQPDARNSSMGEAPSAAEVQRFHFTSDVDSSARALHHTLGTRRNQAAPGNHIHDGISSPRLGARAVGTSAQATVPALVLVGAKGGNVALTNLIALLKNFIDFTDSTT